MKYANVMSTIAAVFALAALCLGGAVAAGVHIPGSKIRPGSITSKQLKNNGVKSADVQNGTIDSEDIGNGDVTPEDVTMPAPGQFQQAGMFTAKVGDPFVALDVVGAYQKTDATSSLEVNWTGSAEAGFRPCIFQLRVDGAAAGPGAGELYVANGSSLSVSASALFAGLPAGPHQIEVWARSPNAGESGPIYDCTVGPSETISQTFIVTEQVV